MAINSKNKGSTYERKIAKAMSEATGDNFKRTPGSGAMGTTSNIQAMQGDVFNADWMDKFPFFFELKKYKAVNLYHFIQNLKSCNITKWVVKMQEQQADYQTGVLIFEEDRGKSIAVVEMAVAPDPEEGRNITVFMCNGKLYQVMLFKDFLETYKGLMTK